MPNFDISEILARSEARRAQMPVTGFGAALPVIGNLAMQGAQQYGAEQQKRSVMQAQQDYAQFLSLPEEERKKPENAQKGYQAALSIGIDPRTIAIPKTETPQQAEAMAAAKARGAASVKPRESEDQKLDRIKKESQARAEGSGALDQKNQGEWDKLTRLTNPSVATRGSLLGVAGINNARADRALTNLKDPNMVVQQLDAVTADVAGIMKGGAPDEQGAAQSRFSNILTRWSALKSQLTSTPTAINNPAVVAKLKQIVKDIKNVDNKIISDNFSSAEQSFKPIIAKDPRRWAEYKKSVMAGTIAPDEQAPTGTITIRDSEGGMHTLPSSQLEAAKKRDPGLTVVSQ